MRKRLQVALVDGKTITVPMVVVAEWWRGRTTLRDQILSSVRVEPLSETLSKLAGEALAIVGGSNAIDAVVIASAAQRGDVLYTSDLDDFARLAAYFRGVRILHA